MKIPENEPKAIINISNQLLQSVLDSIPEIHHFKGKWSLISTKLSDLQTQLSDLSDFPPNSLSLELLHSVILTLSHSLSLSNTCHNPNLPEGKLKTQNDVDSISAMLDRHLSDADVLIKSGLLLLPHDAAAVSTSSISSSTSTTSSSKRESVRVESRNLVTRLQIGTTESKNSSMDSLLGLLQEDDKNVLIAVAQGIIPVLVRLLDSNSSPEIKEKTVTAISRVSTVDSSKHVLIAEGLVLLTNLLRVLDYGSWYAKEKACIALQSLTYSKENARAIGSRGGISSLLEICQAGTPGSQAVAAAVLRNLSRFEEIKENFIEENAISILLALSASGTSLAQENSLGSLCSLVSDDENLKLLIVREGVIESLKNFWDSAPNVRSVEVAVDLLRSLASYPPISDFLVSNGFINRLVSVLNCGVLSVRIASARAVQELGSNNPKARRELGESGSIPPLVRMLEGKAVQEREAAAKALSALMVYPGNQRIFRKEERGIVGAVLLLDPLIQNLNKKYSVSILISIVHSKKCRKQMVENGAHLYLQKLVEMEVEGSKKLLECLRRNKLWGVFGRP